MYRLLLLLSLTASGALLDTQEAVPTPSNPGETIRREGVVMGTPWSLELAGPTRAQALEASEVLIQSLVAAESRLSNWNPDSEVSRWNAGDLGSPLPCSPALAQEIRRAEEWRIATQGAFSPLLGNLVEVWDLRGSGRIPDPAKWTRACSMSRPENLIWLDDQPVRRGPVTIATGGFGKGAALDAA
ncbi:MAG: FAD:protein FMN transferase, partial [Planctomycetes bacterium]|nr:FAD:protein FMN transferase [Planctomycetota bacterium]